MAHLQVTLFGAPLLLRDGEPVRFDTRKALALVAVLAVTGRRHAREELATLLWPESEPGRARAALRRTLFTAAAVGPALVVDRSGVALDEQLVTCDVTEFDDCRRRGDAAAAREGLEWYRGEFLAGFTLRDSPEFEDWRETTGSRRREDLDRMLQVLVADHAARHEWDDAVRHAQRRLALDPLREQAHQDLIRLYAWSGQRTAALRQYRACVRVLERELGVGPLDETTAVYEAVRAHRLAPPDRRSVGPPRTAAGSDPGRPGPTPGTTQPEPPTPFVGRHDEMARLLHAWEQSRESPRVVAVVGDTGSGKSALVARFTEQVAGRGAVTLTVSGHEGEQTLAFAAVTDLLRGVLHERPGLPQQLADPDRAALARLLPAFGGDRDEPGLALDTPGARTRLFAAVRSALAALGSLEAPAVLVVEDLHWFDSESGDLMAFLLRRPPEGLLAVVSWRGSAAPPAVAGAVSEAMRHGAAEMVWLSSLAPHQVRELLAAHGLDASDHVVDDVVLRTGGLPMLVAEYASAVGHVGTEDATRSRVEGLVRARVDAAPPATAQVLAVVAAVAAPVDPDLLRAVSGRTDQEVVAALEDATARGLLVERPHRAAYDFPHDTLRQIVRERTSLARRRLLASRTADALVQRLAHRPGSTTAAAVARQLDAAGREDEAAAWHWRAADDARRLYAHATAAEHLEAALALGHDPVTAHLALGDARLRLGRYDAAIASYEQAAAAVADPRVSAEVEHKLAEVHHRLGEWEVAQAHLESALTLLPAQDTTAGPRSQVLADLALVALRRLEVGSARRCAAEAAELATAVGEPAALAQAYNVLGVLEGRQGSVQTARRHLSASLREAQQLDDPAPAVAALNNLARLEVEAGDLPAALDAAARALELGVRHGDRHRVAALHANLGDLLHLAGRDDESRAHLRESAVLFADVDREAVRRPEVWKLVEW